MAQYQKHRFGKDTFRTIHRLAVRCMLTLPETNIAFENGCLEYKFPFGAQPIFRGENVGFRESNLKPSAHFGRWGVGLWVFGFGELLKGPFFSINCFMPAARHILWQKSRLVEFIFFQETLGTWYWIDNIYTYLCWYYSRNLSFVRNFHLFLRLKSTIIWPKNSTAILDLSPAPEKGDLAGRRAFTGCGSSNISWDFRSLGILYRPWPQPMGIPGLNFWGDSIFNTLDGRHRANQLRLIVYAII